ncbi:bifunctional sulfate adenylyltransferase/adenylylsulfate kinase [Candidatus Pacebacteria bacterium]|nr:bifunctional sulfate adenylyltransferase/adenylylsulfate kinase [Candidatus Paceibacterota bacterium]
MDIDEELLLLSRLNLKDRQLYDLELLMVGGFAPLTGFMTEEEYISVVENMRLPSGELFPMPIVLDVSTSFPHKVGDRILLCDQFGNPLAVMHIESRFTPDKTKEAVNVYGKNDDAHPGVQYLHTNMEQEYIGGSIEVLALPKRNDFSQFRKTPEELKKLFKERKWDKVVGFQTRNPMHKAHFELVKRAHEKTGAPVLVHPVVGMTKPGDIDYVTRVRTYNIVCNTYGKEFTELSLLPLSMRMAGPREALWHAIIRKNYGCTHFIVGRDHAGPGDDSKGNPFYTPYEARDLAERYAREIGIEIVPSDEITYSKKDSKYKSLSELDTDEEIENISGTEFRRRLYAGEEIPEWFSFPESISILRDSVKKDTRPGVTLLFTGLSGAGKSTIAQLLFARLQEIQDRDITFLDGDEIREHLSKGLTFSKEDRDENVKRVGFVASEIVKHGGIVICSLIAPYKAAREYAHNIISHNGIYFEVYISTPIEECERRDSKGLYVKARRGEIENFTGVSDPYEKPENPEMRFDTLNQTPEEIVDEIIEKLQSKNII